MPTNNQNQENSAGRTSQQNPQQNPENQKEENFDNPQQGAKWDNYQTRTLSSESEGTGSKISKEEVEEALKASEPDTEEEA